jgi:inosine/xanthosine triphosphate pyrophosphatase family protein
MGTKMEVESNIKISNKALGVLSEIKSKAATTRLETSGIELSDILRTSTDILRVITSMSGGDVSLAENTRFKNLKRSDRKRFLTILEGIVSEDDIQRHKNKWVKLFHGLHIGEYSKRFPKTFAIASKIRNGEKLDTVNSRIERAILSKDLGTILETLESRPGDFARRLDHILRENTKSRSEIVQSFISVANQVSTRVLMQLIGHFNGRSKEINKRIVFPMGSVSKARILRGKLPELNRKVISSVVSGIKGELFDRFGEESDMGKVFLDESLENCPLPMSQRNASKSLKTVARGTRIPFGDKGTLRFFIHWIGQDIDLSASFHDKDFNLIQQVSYTSVKSESFKSCHSGDITHAPAPAGASEFIDVSIDGALKGKAKYVVMNVLVYSGPSFAEHEACSAGWMTRENVNSNEIYDPKFVEQKVDLTSDSRNAIPVVFDLETREAVWCDLATNSNVSWGGNNIESNEANIKDVLESIVSL